MKRLRGRPFGNRDNPSCKDVAQVLQTFLDGELDTQDVASVQRHLDACKDCGLEAETYEALKQSLQSRRNTIDPDVMTRLRSFTETLVADSSDGS